ncbi:MAG TPA: NAD(P)H-dependent oxidoreductase [Acidimicrobiales bacterium]
MARTLHIVTSPRGARSRSRLVTEAFVEAWRAHRPGEAIDTLDLWRDPVPTFDGVRVDAKMAVVDRAAHDPAMLDAWASLRAAFDRFAAADTYVIGVPMWNGGIPWILKHYVDTVTQPGLLFSFDPDTGYRGLLRGKRAVVAYTSAVYAPGVAPAFGRDFHSTYFEDWLRFAGVDEVHALRLQPTSPRSPDVEARTAAAVADARRLAASLAGRAVA